MRGLRSEKGLTQRTTVNKPASFFGMAQNAYGVREGDATVGRSGPPNIRPTSPRTIILVRATTQSFCPQGQEFTRSGRCTHPHYFPSSHRTGLLGCVEASKAGEFLVEKMAQDETTTNQRSPEQNCTREVQKNCTRSTSQKD